MSTFKDLLVWYNDLDAVPFLEVVEKVVSFGKQEDWNV